MTDTKPVVVYFRRNQFHGDFADKEPKWHLLAEEPESRWGVWTGACGYSRSNILGELTVSRTKTKKKAATVCGKCVTALSKKEST